MREADEEFREDLAAWEEEGEEAYHAHEKEWFVGASKGFILIFVGALLQGIGVAVS